MLSKIKFFNLLLILNLFCPSFILAQVSKKAEPMVLQHADELESNLENQIVSLFGKVWFKQGELDLESQRAIWYQKTGLVIFMGDVNISDPTYDLTSDKVTYYQNSKRAVAEGKVKLVDKTQDIILSGEEAEYQRQQEFLTFRQSPILILNSEKKDSAVTISSQIMEYSRQTQIGTAIGQVQISKGDLKASCGRAEFFNQENKIILTDKPQVQQKESQISGTRMTLLLKDNKLHQMDVEQTQGLYRNVRDTLKKTQEENLLSGKRMIFNLEEEQIQQIQVIGNAQSLYSPASEDTSKIPKNLASGDTVQIFLSNGEVQKVLISGGAQGEYYFIPESADTLNWEDTVRYQASAIEYQVADEKIKLEGNSQLNWKTVSLNAEEIDYDLKNDLLLAFGKKTADKGETTLVGTPILRDGPEEIVGKQMSYDLNSKKGKVWEGKTDFEAGVYRGKLLRKISDQELLVNSARFTTCDKNDPHYYFGSSKMKIITQDKVIARPVILYIGGLPIAVLPFYIFPIKPGRHSGFLALDFGNFTGLDRFVRNIGYYWAASQYWDLETALDVYEESGIIVRNSVRYAVRYQFNGSVAGSFKREIQKNLFTETKNYRWDLQVNHLQTFSPTFTMSAYGTFLSDRNYYRDFNLNADQRRNRILRSQVNFSKRWSTMGASLALDQNLNLDTQSRTLFLPKASFSKSSSPIFPGKPAGAKKWYNSIYYSLNSNFTNLAQRDQDTSGAFLHKKFMTSDNFLSLNFSQNIFRYFSFSPRVNYRETWYYVSNTNLSQKDSVTTENLKRRGTYDVGVNWQTNLYGTFLTKMGNILGFRHVLTPAVGFGFQPKFTQNENLRIFTGAGGFSSERQFMNFSLNNLFQMKVKQNEQERKIELFNLNFSSGYNFKALTRKLSPLSTSLRTSALPHLDLALSAVHDFYDPLSNKFLRFSPRLATFNISSSLNFQGKSATAAPEVAGYTSSSKAGWRVAFSHNYSEFRSVSNLVKTHWLGINAQFPVTRNWFLTYSSRYDFDQKKFADQTFEIYRDLHCWEARLVWIPNGFREGFYFRINIKALPEVKFEKGPGGLGGFLGETLY